MKIFGDVTRQEQSTVDGLARMENLLLRNKKLSKVNQAKGYLYIAAHWYALGLEEEGGRILQKIDLICPEYFKKHLKKHMQEDERFRELITNLFIDFAFLMIHKIDVINK